MSLERNTCPRRPQKASLIKEITEPFPPPRLPLQVIGELSMRDRAAIYTAHCMGRYFTTEMIEAGWLDPQQVLNAFELDSRAQLIAHVQEYILPQVRAELESDRTDMELIQADLGDSFRG